MRTLKELLPRKQLTIPKEIDEKTIFHIAKQVLIEEYGARGGENIIPSYYKNKKLFLSPRSSLWSSEAYLMREHLVSRINAILGSEAVKEIKIAQQM
ncbi:MAG: DciA family protein [Candidatus Moranbacteria bacterium]|nr:DciA family protein [Candidatus Moranbacteria bacterium]